MSEIDTSPEAIEALAARLEEGSWEEHMGDFVSSSDGDEAAALLRALAAEKRDAGEREHILWELGYASGLSAAKKGSAP